MLRWIKIGVLASLLAAGIDPAAAQDVRGEFKVELIRVEGVQRIETETVLSYLSFRRGDRVGTTALDKSLKKLFATGLFSDVSLRREAGAVVVVVTENPVINRLAFEGNLRISDEILGDEVRLRPRIVFTQSRVRSDVQRIIDIYRRQGRFAVQVVPKVIRLDQNRVDLVFEIEEGKLTEIRNLSFIGNKRFDDSKLRAVIHTKESAWWRFLGNDSYDPDRLSFDRELLRRHYLKNGYADFRVVSSIAELTPDRQGFFITFNLDEGERYNFGKIDVTTALKDLNPKELQKHIDIAEGDWYDVNALENSVSNLADAAGSLGYAFVEVRPRVRRNKDKRLIHITFNISEGPRVYVERINIIGNVRTKDEVIRREFQLIEGDAFNTAKLRRSRKQIYNLGFFEKVKINNIPGSSPDKTVVEVEVQERSTGEISLGAGYSSVAGALADISIRERNFIGTGQDLRLSLKIGQREQALDFSYTEPYFLDRNLSAGVDLEKTENDLQSESSYDRNALGMALRMGYPIAENWSQRWKYKLREDKVTNISSSASQVIREQEGEFITSSVGQWLIYDGRDNKIYPKKGSTVAYSNEISGFGGDTNFVQNEVKGAMYHPITDDLVGSVRAGAGYVFGVDDDVRIINRFFMGGANLRGFDSFGVGPRDSSNGDAVGGNWYYRASFQILFPLGLPNEFDIKGRIFSDLGSLGGVDGAIALNDTGSLRQSIGVGLSWYSPMGPISFDFSRAILKEEFDKTEGFRFSFGTRF